jgi:hypothetical protein
MMNDLRLQVRRDPPGVVIRQWRWRILDSNDMEIACNDAMSVHFEKGQAVAAGWKRLEQLRDPGAECEWQDVDPVTELAAHLAEPLS